MNTIGKFWLLLLLIVTAAGLYACTTAPIQEMSDARQTIRAARDAGAAQYAVEKLRAAEKLLRRAEQAIDFHNYKIAHQEARAATDLAAGARNMALAIAAAQAAIETATIKNKAVSAAQALLDKAIAAAARGDEEATIRLALKAKALAEQSDVPVPAR